jgi:hypothetical protein
MFRRPQQLRNGQYLAGLTELMTKLSSISRQIVESCDD